MEFYLMKSIPKDGVSMTMWEIHGNCYFRDVDVSTWSVDDEAECGLGFIYETTKVDWLVIKMLYKGTEASSLYSCEDGHSSSTASNEYTLDTTQNCHSNADKSSISFSQGNTEADVTLHFMKMYMTTDENGQDTELMPSQTVEILAYFKSPTTEEALNESKIQIYLNPLEDAVI
mmetsp:Transcript_16390/g.27760  ORF Transcript_16390/g.27760 Transcript_16390/m.27760 type:complete len:174 (+) Transcript_16390:196-717(+)|eukprot:CAMPEP_0168611176 /NCGR_PEP_ID=MMETSP0449_2-20121227/2212_1 /TAXON_ID=1082188 /ORGANISM="Strombidium rassoulzadegani, Strain ras09" /LENGTH=173 /DNA_ID=CAMNT_0008651593 /DNA_START=98 /DNA_END=619 /DNA_ORIENTATION=-